MRRPNSSSNSSNSNAKRNKRPALVALGVAFTLTMALLRHKETIVLGQLFSLSSTSSGAAGQPVLQQVVEKEILDRNFHRIPPRVRHVERGDTAAVEDHDADATRTTTKNKKRPKLYLHVGPPKTGTTFLQCSLCSSSSSITSTSLSNVTTVTSVLERDNFVYLGTCPPNCFEEKQSKNNQYIQHSFRGFFPKPATDSTSAQQPRVLLGQDVQNHLNAALVAGKNAILVFEDLHRLSPRHLQVLADTTLTSWNVEIVVAYRRLTDWLPSMYNQMTRPSKLKRNAAEWPAATRSNGRMLGPFDLDNRGDFTTLVQRIESTGQHPVATVVEHYTPFFDKITVVDLHNLNNAPQSTHQEEEGGGGDAYLQHLFCSVLDAPHTCRAVMAAQIGAVDNKLPYSNPTRSLNYELLAVHAYETGLIPHKDAAGRAVVSRQVVVSAIQRYQEKQLNATVDDFPIKCLSSSTLNRLIALSVRVDANLFGESVARATQHRQDFGKLVEANQFCHVDVEQVVKDTGWINLFSSLRHGRQSSTRSIGSRFKLEPSN